MAAGAVDALADVPNPLSTPFDSSPAMQRSFRPYDSPSAKRSPSLPKSVDRYEATNLKCPDSIASLRPILAEPRSSDNSSDSLQSLVTDSAGAQSTSTTLNGSGNRKLRPDARVYVPRAKRMEEERRQRQGITANLDDAHAADEGRSNGSDRPNSDAQRRPGKPRPEIPLYVPRFKRQEMEGKASPSLDERRMNDERRINDEKRRAADSREHDNCAVRKPPEWGMDDDRRHAAIIDNEKNETTSRRQMMPDAPREKGNKKHKNKRKGGRREIDCGGGLGGDESGDEIGGAITDQERKEDRRRRKEDRDKRRLEKEEKRRERNLRVDDTVGSDSLEETMAELSRHEKDVREDVDHECVEADPAIVCAIPLRQPISNTDLTATSQIPNAVRPSPPPPPSHWFHRPRETMGGWRTPPETRADLAESPSPPRFSSPPRRLQQFRDRSASFPVPPKLTDDNAGNSFRVSPASDAVKPSAGLDPPPTLHSSPRSALKAAESAAPATSSSSSSSSLIYRRRPPKNLDDDDELAANEVPADEDTWESLFDEDGVRLDTSLDDLSSAVENVVVLPPADQQLPESVPKEPKLAYESFGHVLEIFDFHPSTTTQDLQQVFASFQRSGFEVKWVDDTHAMGVFASPSAAAEALAVVNPIFQVRPLGEATFQTKVKAKKFEEMLSQTYKERPQTTAIAARRMVAGALGLRSNVSKEKREKEREQLRIAKERKRAMEEAKGSVDAWEGDFGPEGE